MEKANREEQKKEQEGSNARPSLKERLASKKKEVSKGKEQDTQEHDNTKKSQREM